MSSRLLPILLGLALCQVHALLLHPEAQAAEPLDREQAEAQLMHIVEQLNALDTWLSDAERQRVRWLKDVQAKDQQVAQTSLSVDAADARLAKMRGELDALTDERDRLNERLAEQARRIEEHLAAAYRLSGQDFLKLILNQESPETVERMAVYHRYFSDARMQALEAYRGTSAELERVAKLVQSQHDAEVEEQADLRNRQRELESERRQRQSLLAELDEEVEDRVTLRKRLVADQDRLQRLVAELRRRASELDGTQFATRKGALPWPVSGTVQNRFGQSRADGRLKWHGVRFGATEGTPVTAVFRGQVVFADWLRGFGLLTIVDHGSGFMTLYGHADDLTKRVGDMVESGEVIAHAGQSGGQLMSGLYFEVRQNGDARDPLGWLAKSRTGH